MEAPSLLIVEDDRQVARALSRVLGRVGYSVIAAPSYVTAQVLACRFDVAVFDIDLGDGDGVELARAMLADGRVDHAFFYTAEQDPRKLARASKVAPVICKQEGTDSLLPLLYAVMPRSNAPVSGIQACQEPPRASSDRASGE